MRKKIFLSYLALSFALIISLTALIITVTYNDFLSQVKLENTQLAQQISIGYEHSGLQYIHRIGGLSNRRITIVSEDGVVVYDNQVDIHFMENHLERVEITEAIANGYGEYSRVSSTLDEMTHYYALRLDSNMILRLSVTSTSMINIFDKTSDFLIIIVILNLIFAFYISRVISRGVLHPINKIDLENPLQNDIYYELTPLLKKMHNQNEKINEQINELQQKKYEFNLITEGMSDALVIFSSNKCILTANKSSKIIFGNDIAEGKSYIEFCRNHQYITIVEQAFSGKASTAKYMFENKCYTLTATPVPTEGDFAVVLFGSDITQNEQNEQVRRNFSANVSHELKTPLTSIIGFSDIMLNGIAKQEDFNNFIKKINSEANRLLILIEDIIRISNLEDDTIKREFTPVNLHNIATSVITQLEFKANQRNIKIALEPDCDDSNLYSVNGVEHSLNELIFNLCDNAVSYNKDDGDVLIELSHSAEQVVLSVTDTGIGIPSEEKEHIFERFYRVDKSHSKNTGGTGLGLSIVKHIILLHNATINVNSQLGKGTKIEVVFTM